MERLVTTTSKVQANPKIMMKVKLRPAFVFKSNPSNNQKPAILDDNAINKYPRDASKPLLENKVPKALDENLFANVPDYKNKQAEKAHCSQGTPQSHLKRQIVRITRPAALSYRVLHVSSCSSWTFCSWAAKGFGSERVRFLC